MPIFFIIGALASLWAARRPAPPSDVQQVAGNLNVIIDRITRAALRFAERLQAGVEGTCYLYHATDPATGETVSLVWICKSPLGTLSYGLCTVDRTREVIVEPAV